MSKWYDVVNMNRMVFFRSLAVAAVIFFAHGMGARVYAQATLGGPCVAPVTADHTCTDVSSLSEADRTARDCRARRCMGLGDGVLCCRAAPAPAASDVPVPAEQSQSNVQGAAAAQTGAAITSGGGSCSYNGVKDPFCGKSVAEIIGKAIQFLLGAAGALFLAMFVYGGATWLTAGSSDRHEQAQKTLLNAAAGILVVILSYTMVSLLIRFAGGFGVGQTDTQAVITEEVSPAGGGASGAATGGSSGGSFLDRLLGRAGIETTPPTPEPVAPVAPSGGGGGACNASSFIAACRVECADSLVVGFVGLRAECDAACGTYGPGICSRVRVSSDCPAACSSFCATEVVEEARSFCASECPDLCTAAFR